MKIVIAVSEDGHFIVCPLSRKDVWQNWFRNDVVLSDLLFNELQIKAEEVTEGLLHFLCHRGGLEIVDIPDTRYRLRLLDPGVRRIGVMKTVRELTGMPLVEARDFVRKGLDVIWSSQTLEACQRGQKRLTEVGATTAIEEVE